MAMDRYLIYLSELFGFIRPHVNLFIFLINFHHVILSGCDSHPTAEVFQFVDIC